MSIFSQIQEVIDSNGGSNSSELVQNELSQKSISIWEIIVESNSWYILIPLFIMSLYAVYIFIERLLEINKAIKEESTFMSRIKDYLYNGKIDNAKDLCKSTDNPIARMIEKGVSRIGKPMNDIAISIENVAKIEVYKLENKISALGTISGLAPMIGFLGTVIGMIEVFYNLKETGIKENFLQTLSGGVMMAMVTTVAGLIVGIVSYFFYNYLVSKVSKAIQKMESSSIEFIDMLEEPTK